MHNSANSTSSDKGGKNEYSLRKKTAFIYTHKIIHRKKGQMVKKGSGPQQGYPSLQNSPQRETPLPPRH